MGLLDDEKWHGRIFTGAWQRSAGGDAAVVAPATARNWAGRFAPTAVLRIQGRYPRVRWRRRVPGVIDLADPRAESLVARLDMAYPLLKLAIEYDGGATSPHGSSRRTPAASTA